MERFGVMWLLGSSWKKQILTHRGLALTHSFGEENPKNPPSCPQACVALDILQLRLFRSWAWLLLVRWSPSPGGDAAPEGFIRILVLCGEPGPW